MDDLRYHFKYENIREISFNDFDNAFELLKKRHAEMEITLQDAKTNRNKYKSNLNDIQTGKFKNILNEQKRELHKINKP